MTPAQAAKAIDKIVEGPGTKSARARALYELGCDRTDAVELLEMNYSQAHSVWKEFHGKTARSGSDQLLRSSDPRSGETDSDVESGGAGSNGSRRYALQLSPSQTRVATQDGHRVIKVDRAAGGVTCRNCEASLSFSIRWLAFVHTFSKKDPTDLEDTYQ